MEPEEDTIKFPEKQWSKRKYDRFNLAILGQTDSGRKTLGGYLLHNHIDNRNSLSHIELNNPVKIECGAKLLENLKAQLQRMSLVRELKFATEKYLFHIVDIPGHKQFMQNLITGKTDYNCSVVVVPSIVQGIRQQRIQNYLKDQLQILKWFDKLKFIICISKMDLNSFNHQQYEQRKRSIVQLLQRVEINPEHIPIIPISSLTGDNICKKSPQMPWYKGPTLIQQLNKCIPHRRYSLDGQLTKKPLRIAVEDVYRIGGIGIVPVGKVLSGYMNANETGRDLIVSPTDIRIKFKYFQMHHEPTTEAFPGDNTGFSIKGVNHANEIRRGSIIGSVNPPPRKVSEIVALVSTKSQLTEGVTGTFRIHNTSTKITILRILHRVDSRTGKVLELGKNKSLNMEVGIICIKFDKIISCEVFNQIPPLGRFKLNVPFSSVGIILQARNEL